MKSNNKTSQSSNSKNVLKVFLETNSTNFFEENIILKNPDSFLNVLLFILGEFTTINIKTENDSNEFFKKVLIFIHDIPDSIQSSNFLKKNYFYIYLVLVSRILLNSKVILDENDVIKINNVTINFEEYIQKLSYKLNKLLTYEDLFDMEIYGILQILRKIFSIIQCEKNNNYFKEFNSQKQLLPLHKKAHMMVLLEKDNDLIKFCFPIDNEELVMESKINKKSKEIINEQNKKDFKNSNQDINQSNQEKTNKFLLAEKNEGNRIVIDHRIYAPNNN